MMTLANLLKKPHPVKCTVLSLILALLASAGAGGQIGPNPAATALAGSVAARTEDIGFARTNPATLAGREPLLVASFAPSNIGIEGYYETGVTTLLQGEGPLRMGLSAQGLGAGGYSQIAGSLHACVDLPGDITLGGTVMLHSLAIERYGSALDVSCDAGALAHLTERIRFGGFIRNLAGSGGTDEEFSRQIGFGFAFDTGNATTLSLDARHESGRPASVALGLSTSPVAPLTIRAGIASAPGTVALGAGYELHDVLFDYGSAYIWPLGFRHVMGAGIRW